MSIKLHVNNLMSICYLINSKRRKYSLKLKDKFNKQLS